MSGVIATRNRAIVAGSPTGGSPSVTPFTAEAVTFDGTNDYLIRNSAWSGSPSATKFLSGSCWVRLNTPAGITNRLFQWEDSVTNERYTLIFAPPGETYSVTLYGRDTSGVSLNFRLGRTDINDNAWHHVTWAIHMDSLIGTKVYLDGINAIPNAAYVQPNGSNIGWDNFQYQQLCTFREDSRFHLTGDVSEFWCSNEYLDWGRPEIYAKFATGDPPTPIDLGSDGSKPTGTQPIVYFTGTASVWNAGTNAGSGGNFTMNGAVTDSSNEPIIGEPLPPDL